MPAITFAKGGSGSFTIKSFLTGGGLTLQFADTYQGNTIDPTRPQMFYKLQLQ